VIPITSTLRNIPFHVIVQPPEGGLTNASAFLCEAVRSINKDHLIIRWGSVSATTMATVEDRLRVLMGL
jgi:mRNA interferase MazF